MARHDSHPAARRAALSAGSWPSPCCAASAVSSRFIGVSVLGALVLGAVRDHAPTATLIAALLVVAPLAGVLHWLESWIAHAMAYALLAEMRIDLFRKLDALAPAYLLRRRSGDLVALATQDVETVEYFFAHTIAPAIVAVLVPGVVMAALAWIAWPLAAGSGALPAVRGRLADPRAPADRPAGIGRARRAGDDQRLYDRDHPGTG